MELEDDDEHEPHGMELDDDDDDESTTT